MRKIITIALVLIGLGLPKTTTAMKFWPLLKRFKSDLQNCIETFNPEKVEIVLKEMKEANTLEGKINEKPYDWLDGQQNRAKRTLLELIVREYEDSEPEDDPEALVEDPQGSGLLISVLYLRQRYGENYMKPEKDRRLLEIAKLLTRYGATVSQYSLEQSKDFETWYLNSIYGTEELLRRLREKNKTETLNNLGLQLKSKNKSISITFNR